MTTTAKKPEVLLPPWIWIALVVVGLGGMGVAWGLQLVQGMGITGLGQQVVWGLYIAGFFTAMGAGAALVAFAALSEFSPLILISQRRNVLLLALVNFVIGGLLITMDVGNPVNLWRILTAGRFSSMMTWDFWALIVTGILTLVYLVLSWNETTSASNTRVWSTLALISAVLLVVVEGWMLATMAARPLWNGGITVVNFLVAALVTGLAMAILTWKETAPKLTGWLMTGLWITLVLVLAEVLTVGLEENARPHPEIIQLLSGAFSPIFWLYMIAGLLVPLAILVWRKDLTWLRVVAVLAILGVIAEKLWLLAAGQALPWVGLPQGFYSPSWIEYLGLIGSIALGVLIYRVLTSLVFKAK